MNGITNIIKERFGPAIKPSDQELVRGSAVYLNWLSKALNEFKIEEVYFIAAQIVLKKSKPHVLFLHLSVKAFGPQGQVPGTLFLRGNATAVLVEIASQGEKYYLMTEQPRLGPGEAWSLEIPAGMLDGSADPREVAVRELLEETGLNIKSEELITLNINGNDLGGVSQSPGVSDEQIFLFALSINMTMGELKALQGQWHGCAEEGEVIRLKLLTWQELAPRLTDAKSLQAVLLWRAMKGEF